MREGRHLRRDFIRSSSDPSSQTRTQQADARSSQSLRMCAAGGDQMYLRHDPRQTSKIMRAVR